MGRDVMLAGRVVAVTGGARGIGRAVATALVAEGARVAVGDLDADLAAEAAAGLGPNAAGLALDATDRGSFTRFLDAARDRFGPPDVLVNNAGVMHLGPFLGEPDDATARQVDVNLHGVLLGMKLALPAMVARGDGHVVNVSSLAGRIGLPGGVTYSATKHAVVGASEALRWELRGTGVEISVLVPGVVDTELAAGEAPTRLGVLTTEEVAGAVVAVLRRPRFEVVVPRAAGALLRAGSLLPRRPREAAARAIGVDRVLAAADPAARAAYEARAARRNAPSP